MRELSESEIDDILTRNGIGTLALSDGEMPYPIPMSFGYDGEKPLFVMQFGEGNESRKRACVDSSQKAGFLVYEQIEAEPNAEWHSVVMSGELTEAEEADSIEAFSTLASNAQFAPDMTVWGVSLEDAELTLFELEIEELSGRAFSIDS